ncbi:MAG: starch synthase, partial [Marivirga sp.]
LAKNYNVKKSHIVSIPHGHFEIYKKFKDHNFKTKDKNYILFFGRIWKYKGLQYFIDAANLIIQRHPKTMFYIVGKGEELSKYSFEEKNKDNFFIDNRRVTLGEAAVYYQNASVVVLPYIEATQSGVIPAAYAFGKPVIATKVGAIHEIVKNNQTGILVQKMNVVDLAGAIEKLISNPKTLKQYGSNALYFANNFMAWNQIGHSTYKTYKELL